MDETTLAQLVDFGSKLAKLDEMHADMKQLKGELHEVKIFINTVEVLTPEEIMYIRAGKEARELEKEFWQDLKKRLAGAGAIGVVGILLTALWFYVKHQLNNGGTGL